ncbi:uncharacterized protein LOC100179464 [Ciona intestinalis]
MVSLMKKSDIAENNTRTGRRVSATIKLSNERCLNVAGSSFPGLETKFSSDKFVQHGSSAVRSTSVQCVAESGLLIRPLQSVELVQPSANKEIDPLKDQSNQTILKPTPCFNQENRQPPTAPSSTPVNYRAEKKFTLGEQPFYQSNYMNMSALTSDDGDLLLPKLENRATIIQEYHQSNVHRAKTSISQHRFPGLAKDTVREQSRSGTACGGLAPYFVQSTINDVERLPAIHPHVWSSRDEKRIEYRGFVSALPMSASRPGTVRDKFSSKIQKTTSNKIKTDNKEEPVNECWRCALRMEHSKCETTKYIRIGGGFRHSYWFVRQLIEQAKEEEEKQLNLLRREQRAIFTEKLAWRVNSDGKRERRIKTFVRSKSGRRIEKYEYVSEDVYNEMVSLNDAGKNATHSAKRRMKEKLAASLGLNPEDANMLDSWDAQSVGAEDVALDDDGIPLLNDDGELISITDTETIKKAKQRRNKKRTDDDDSYDESERADSGLAFSDTEARERRRRRRGFDDSDEESISGRRKGGINDRGDVSQAEVWREGKKTRDEDGNLSEDDETMRGDGKKKIRGGRRRESVESDYESLAGTKQRGHRKGRRNEGNERDDEYESDSRSKKRHGKHGRRKSQHSEESLDEGSRTRRRRKGERKHSNDGSASDSRRSGKGRRRRGQHKDKQRGRGGSDSGSENDSRTGGKKKKKKKGQTGSGTNSDMDSDNLDRHHRKKKHRDRAGSDSRDSLSDGSKVGKRKKKGRRERHSDSEEYSEEGNGKKDRRRKHRHRKYSSDDEHSTDGGRKKRDRRNKGGKSRNRTSAYSDKSDDSDSMGKGKRKKNRKGRHRRDKDAFDSDESYFSGDSRTERKRKGKKKRNKEDDQSDYGSGSSRSSSRRGLRKKDKKRRKGRQRHGSSGSGQEDSADSEHGKTKKGKRRGSRHRRQRGRRDSQNDFSDESYDSRDSRYSDESDDHRKKRRHRRKQGKHRRHQKYSSGDDEGSSDEDRSYEGERWRLCNTEFTVAFFESLFHLDYINDIINLIELISFLPDVGRRRRRHRHYSNDSDEYASFDSGADAASQSNRRHHRRRRHRRRRSTSGSDYESRSDDSSHRDRRRRRRRRHSSRGSGYSSSTSGSHKRGRSNRKRHGRHHRRSSRSSTDSDPDDDSRSRRRHRNRKKGRRHKHHSSDSSSDRHRHRRRRRRHHSDSSSSYDSISSSEYSTSRRKHDRRRRRKHKYDDDSDSYSEDDRKGKRRDNHRRHRRRRYSTSTEESSAGDEKPSRRRDKHRRSRKFSDSDSDSNYSYERRRHGKKKRPPRPPSTDSSSLSSEEDAERLAKMSKKERKAYERRRQEKIVRAEKRQEQRKEYERYIDKKEKRKQRRREREGKDYVSSSSDDDSWVDGRTAVKYDKGSRRKILDRNRKTDGRDIGYDDPDDPWNKKSHKREKKKQRSQKKQGSDSDASPSDDESDDVSGRFKEKKKKKKQKGAKDHSADDSDDVESIYEDVFQEDGTVQRRRMKVTKKKGSKDKKVYEDHELDAESEYDSIGSADADKLISRQIYDKDGEVIRLTKDGRRIKDGKISKEVFDISKHQEKKKKKKKDKQMLEKSYEEEYVEEFMDEEGRIVKVVKKRLKEKTTALGKRPSTPLTGQRRVQVLFLKGGTHMQNRLKQLLEECSLNDSDPRFSVSAQEHDISDLDEKGGAIDYLSHYRLVEPANLEIYGKAFLVEDGDENYLLNMEETRVALEGIPSLQGMSDKQINYILRVLGIDETTTVTFKMFAVVCALCERFLSIVDDQTRQWMEINDLADMERKIALYRAMFYWNTSSDRSSNYIKVTSLRIELIAGGLSRAQEDYVINRIEPNPYREVSFIDYMAFIPLFLITHESIIDNPLDMSRDKISNDKVLEAQRDMVPLGRPMTKAAATTMNSFPIPYEFEIQPGFTPAKRIRLKLRVPKDPTVDGDRRDSFASSVY